MQVNPDVKLFPPKPISVAVEFPCQEVGSLNVQRRKRRSLCNELGLETQGPTIIVESMEQLIKLIPVSVWPINFIQVYIKRNNY